MCWNKPLIVLYTDVCVFLILASVTVPVTSSSNCNESSWSEWIDRGKPDSGVSRRRLSGEFEAMQPEEKQLFCHDGAIVGVQCNRARNSNSKGQHNFTCSVEDGLRCYDKDNSPDGCMDYKIRYFCECPQGIHKRSTSADTALLKNCGKWSQWKNTHHPSDSDQDDKEAIDQSLCPTDIGATIPIIQCRDEHTNKTFQGEINFEWFIVTCKDVHSGLACKHVDGKCNDFSVRFFCSCSLDVSKQGNADVSCASQHKSQPETRKGTVCGIKHGDWKTTILWFVVLAIVFTILISGVLLVLYRQTLRMKQTQSVYPVTPKNYSNKY